MIETIMQDTPYLVIQSIKYSTITVNTNITLMSSPHIQIYTIFFIKYYVIEHFFILYNKN